MTNTFLFADMATSNLASAITNASTTIAVTTGTGAGFPQPGANQQFALILNSASGGSAYEIVYVTSVTGDTFTVLRGQEGTAAQNWNVGDIAFNGITSGQLAAMQQTATAPTGFTLTGAVTGTASFSGNQSPSVVTTIANGAVLTAMLASGAVTGPTIGGGAVGAGNLAAGAAVSNIGFEPLNPGNNLSELTSKTAATGNLGFAANLAQNGYNKSGTGLIEMWGFVSGVSLSTGQTTTITFTGNGLSGGFPTACVYVSATPTNPGANNVAASMQPEGSASNTGVTFVAEGYNSGGEVPITSFYWRALGY